MPQMGESIAEGTVSKWLKQIGEAVARDEPILEISTDKVDAEIPSPSAGTLVEITVQEGETVDVGTVVAYIDTDASASVSAPAQAAAGAFFTQLFDQFFMVRVLAVWVHAGRPGTCAAVGNLGNPDPGRGFPRSALDSS